MDKHPSQSEPKLFIVKKQSSFDVVHTSFDIIYSCWLILPFSLVKNDSHFIKVSRWLRNNEASIIFEGDSEAEGAWKIQFQTKNARLMSTLSDRCQVIEKRKSNANNRVHFNNDNENDYSDFDYYEEDLNDEIIRESIAYSDAYVSSIENGWFYEDEESADGIKSVLSSFDEMDNDMMKDYDALIDGAFDPY